MNRNFAVSGYGQGKAFLQTKDGRREMEVVPWHGEDYLVDPERPNEVYRIVRGAGGEAGDSAQAVVTSSLKGIISGICKDGLQGAEEDAACPEVR